MPKRRYPSEDSECEMLATWLRGRRWKFSHIANENKARDRKTAAIRGRARYKLGVTPGVPDYLIIVPPRPMKDELPVLLFVEMKRHRKAYPQTSYEQKQWISWLGEVPGVLATICYGFDEARSLIESVYDRMHEE